MTNKEAIEYIERECQTCKGFYAPENECIAVPKDCFESKRLAISAIQEREEREELGIACFYCTAITSLIPNASYCPMCGRKLGDK